MPWPISNHGSPDVDLVIPAVTAPHYLWAILAADGENFRGGGSYEQVRKYLQHAISAFSKRSTGGQAPNPNISDQRLRTWKSEFEEMGLLTVDEDGAVRATLFGKAVVDGLEKASETVDSANRHTAELGAQVANRVLLAKPDSNGNLPTGVPADADLRPLRAMWRAFRKLGNNLHWQDINRVLGYVEYERDVEDAIDHIANFRRLHPDGYSDSTALSALGTNKLTDDPRHITPWFNRAGLGGMLIPSEPDGRGFRTLAPASAAVIDALLSETIPIVPANAKRERSAYIIYLMEPVERVEKPAVSGKDADTVGRIMSAIKDFGQKRFIVLSGLPGTGKSRLAKIVADQLSNRDPLRLKDIQFHESTTYEDFMEGFVPRPDGQGFERKDKTFRIINKRAIDDPSQTYVLLIEEFTRANVPSVMGELLTFVEHRARQFTLSLSQEEISIAPNLVILATMNPRDRSALTLDDAVARRMYRIAVQPSKYALESMLDGVLPGLHLAELSSWYETHMDVLPFGHGVFEGATGPIKLQSIWHGTVVPLLSDPLGRILDAYRLAHDTFPFATVNSGQDETAATAQTNYNA